MAIDDQMAWAPRFAQLWHQAYSADGSVLAAIAATGFGAFTVAVNGTPWNATFPVVTDLAISPAGGRVAALGSEYNTNFAILCDGKVWPGRYDMRKCLAGLVVGLVALAAGAAWAQEPAQEPAKAPAKDDHRQVSDVQVLSVVGHCFYGPNLDEAQAKRLCRQQVRGTLLDRAVAGFGAEPGVRGSGLSGRELRAFVDSLLTVDPVEEETRRVPEGLALRLTLRGAVRPGDRIEQVAVFLTDGAARSAALARLAEHDRLAAEARMPKVRCPPSASSISVMISRAFLLAVSSSLKW